jgi:hypothetical protein
MLEHSPAPWTIESGDDEDELAVWDSDFGIVCEIYGQSEACNPGAAQDRLFADARLIVASPKMYSLLTKLVLAAEHSGPVELFEIIRDARNLLNDIEKNEMQAGPA